MVHLPRRRWRSAAVVILAWATACLALVVAPPADALTAASTPPDPKVGALFIAGHARHYCSASVVHSPRHDLVVTAAHCVVGAGLRMRFVPALQTGSRPYGTWPVAHLYLRPEWINRHDWQHDYAFVELQRITWRGAPRNIEDVVGANQLAGAPAPGQRVAVTGYVGGVGGKPISCGARVYYRGAFPAFDCHGYFGGVSGSPWVTNGRLHGVIGGFHQGGCVEATSYSSRFSADTTMLYQRASSGRRPDVAPGPVGDGC